MKALSFHSLAGLAVLIVGCSGGIANEWPQYRGGAGDGISAEKINSWPAGGPKQLWVSKTPAGFSSFSVAEGKVFTVVSRDVNGNLSEVCVAMDAASGKELWASPTGPAKYRGGGDSGAEGNTGGDGPRSTPTVSAHRVYVYSAHLVLHCLDADSGKVVWKKDITADFSGHNIDWESAISPVIDGDLVYIAGGGSGQAMLAFNKANGEIAWKNGNEVMTQATPVVATIQEVRQVIFLMQSGLVALEASSGKELWKFPFPFRVATGCSPVVANDVVFCTAGYGTGGAACKVTRDGSSFAATELWRVKGDSQVACLWSTPVCKDGYLYGMISFKKFGQAGPLKCVDLKTGKVKWEQPGFGAGNVLLAGNDLIALSDDGQVVVVEANPDAYKELARTKAIQGKCWSAPALSNGRLYVRSTKEGACLDLTAGQ
jgi:outer membrane protein assembly factor BamB